MDRSEIAIVIPAHNEECTIRAVVKEAGRFGIPIVVDDASSDNTACEAQKGGAVLVQHDVNRGYDGAICSGFARAVTMGVRGIVTMDADGQHDASLVARYAKLLDGYDLIVGVRPKRARLSEKVFCLVVCLRYGIRDPLCGMKGYRVRLYEDLGHFDCYGSIGTELTLYAVRNSDRYRIAQIPMNICRRHQGNPRFGGSLKANLKILRALVRGLHHRCRGIDPKN